MERREDAAWSWDSCFFGRCCWSSQPLPGSFGTNSSSALPRLRERRAAAPLPVARLVLGQQTPLFPSLPGWTSRPGLLRFEHSGAYVVFPEGCLGSRHGKEAGHKLGCLRTRFSSYMEAFDLEKPLYQAQFPALVPRQSSCQSKGKVPQILFVNAPSAAACGSRGSRGLRWGRRICGGRACRWLSGCKRALGASKGSQEKSYLW